MPDYKPIIAQGTTRADVRLSVVLLAGGDKRTQDADIERAVAIAKEWREK